MNSRLVTLVACLALAVGTVPATAMAQPTHRSSATPTVAGAAPSAVAPTSTARTLIYGIDDSNDIWEINPLDDTYSLVNATGLAGTQVSNSMAYDKSRDVFYFTYRGTSAGLSNSLLSWNRQTTGIASLTAVATLAELGIGTDPANASFWNGAYWFISANAQRLTRVRINYVAGVPTLDDTRVYNLADYVPPLYPASGYGDIAIDEDDGMLYGSTAGANSLFFTLDLTKLDDTSLNVYTAISTGGVGLQLSFNSNSDVLYGQYYNDATWYTIDTVTGARALLPSLTTPAPPSGRTGFRDLGGAATAEAGVRCVIVAGTNQQDGVPSAALPLSLRVSVDDSQTPPTPIKGLEITFTALSDDTYLPGGTVGGETSATVLTDDSGIATAPPWILGPTPGKYGVRAKDGGTACDVTFEATAANASLALTKRADDTDAVTTYLAAGAVIPYTILGRNSGAVPLTNVSIADPLIAGLTCSPALPVASLAADDTILCTGTRATTAADVTARTFTNTATITGTATVSGNAFTISRDDTATVYYAGLNVAKTASPTSYSAAGQAIAYTITATNSGSVALTGVTISDPLLPGLTCAPATPTTLTAGSTITCTGTYTVTAADVSAGSIANTASAAATTPDNKAVTGTAGVTIPYESPTPPGPGNPRLSIAKLAQPATFTSAGDEITYRVTATNTGDVPLSNVVVDDTATPLNCSPASGSTLPVGARMVCTGIHIVTEEDIARKTVLNTASASGAHDGRTVTDVATATVHYAGLRLTKSVREASFTSIGEVLNYSIRVVNSGAIALTDVTVIDDSIALTCSPTQPVTSLPPGGIIECTGQHVITQADLDRGEVINIAQARGSTPSGTIVEDRDAAVSIDPQAARLDVTKSAEPTTYARVGDELRYRITVTNTGGTTLRGVTVTDSKLTDLRCSPAIPVRQVLAGQSVACTGTYRVDQRDVDRGRVVNRARASGLDPNGEPVTGTARETVTATEATPALTLIKSAAPTKVYLGDIVTYTFELSNTGNVTLRRIAVSDPLLDPAPKCKATSLSPGRSTTCKGSYTVTQADVNRGSVVNTATGFALPARGKLVPPRDTATVEVRKSWLTAQDEVEQGPDKASIVIDRIRHSRDLTWPRAQVICMPLPLNVRGDFTYCRWWWDGKSIRVESTYPRVRVSVSLTSRRINGAPGKVEWSRSWIVNAR